LNRALKEVGGEMGSPGKDPIESRMNKLHAAAEEHIEIPE
jgi:hypothetical protein